MSFLLDRDTCEAWVRGVPRVRSRFVQHRSSLCVSAVTMMGVGLWLLHPNTPVRCMQGYTALMQHVSVVSVDEPVAARAARLGAALRGQKPYLSPLDLLVAATALEHSLTLVTHDAQHYSRVTGLTIVDWMVP